MSNPNTTPTYERPTTTNEVVAQNAGGLAAVRTTELVRVHEWTAMSEPEVLRQWPGYDDKGMPKLGRQAQLKEKLEKEQEELRRQAVDVAGEQNSLLDVA